MSSNRGQKNIGELDKDFIDCEKYLNRVLKRKIEKPRPSANKSKQNDNQNRAVRVFLTGPSSRPHSSSAGLRVGVNKKPSSERLIRKETMGSSKATVEVTVKAKQKDKHRRRSLSTGSAVPKGDKINELSEQTNLIDPLASCKLPSRVFQGSSRSKSPPTKHLPWSEVLKENTNPKSQEITGIDAPVNGKCHEPHDPALNVRAHIGNKESVRSKPVIKSRTHTLEQLRKKHTNRVETKHVKSKETSGESSGFSSSMDEVEYANKGVQCWMPPSSALHGDSTTTVSSTKIVEEVNMKTLGLGVGATRNMDDTFSMFNPVRTLNFLIKELHGFVQKTNDKNLRRIIMDMEKALVRIPSEQHGGDFPANSVPYPASDPDTVRISESTGHTLKHSMPLTAETVARTLASVPALALRVDSSLFSNLDNNSGKTTLSAAVHADSSAVVFQKQLEESCMKLEAMCQEMETNNTELRNQRDKLEEELKQKNKELDAWVAKERDYLQTVSTLRSNLESSGRAMAELTTLTAQLREENKLLSAVHDSQSKMNKQLQESQRANEQLQKEIQLLQLEREKLMIINQGKDNELERFKKEVKDIKTMVMEQLTSLKSSIQEEMAQTTTSYSGIFSNETDLDSGTTSHGTHFTMTPRRPVCSSPNSSKSSFSKVDASWQMLSSIAPLTSEQSHSEVLVLSPVKEKESFKSLQADSVEITEVSDVDETGSNEPTIVVQTAQTQELKDELKLLFDEVRKQSKLSSTNISVPSPPHQFSLMEPEGISQWTESQLNSPVHSAVLSASDAESKPDIKDNHDDLAPG